MNDMQIDDIYELSPMQLGMLFQHLYAPGSDAYINQIMVDVKGRLDREAVRQALEGVLERHGVLRTAFAWKDVEKPYQVVHRSVGIQIEHIDLEALPEPDRAARIEAWLEADRLAGFDLSEAPLLRLALMTLGPDETRLAWTFHHIILEGLSFSIVLGEFWKILAGISLGKVPDLPTPTPYSSYIGWLRTRDRWKAEQYWRKSLHGIRAATHLSLDSRPGGERTSGVGVRSTTLEISQPCLVGLRELARSHRLTLNTLIQGAVAILMSRHSGKRNVMFGEVVSGRPADLPDSHAIVGLFVNTLPARIDVDGEATLVEWLEAVQRQRVEMREFSWCSLVEVQGWSEVPRGQPLFELLYVFESTYYEASAADAGAGTDLRLENFSFRKSSDQPLTIDVFSGKETLAIAAFFDPERFEERDVERVLDDLRKLVEAMVASPRARISELSLASAEDEELLQYLLEREDESARAPELERRPAGEEAPLSFGQQRLWMIDQIEGDNRALHLSLAMRLRGPLNYQALCKALDEVVARHEVLRTRLVMKAGEMEPVQQVLPSLSIELPVEDLADDSAGQRGMGIDVMQELMGMPFDLAAPPLIRARLVRFGPEEHSLMLVLHHAVTDRLSLLLMTGEIMQLYDAFDAGRPSPLAEPPVQYGDYALWERRRLKGPRVEALLAYWRRQLAALEPLELPLDRPRPAVQKFAGATETIVLPSAALESFDRIARRSGATRFMALLTVFVAVLQRYGGQTDVVVGTPVTNRNDPALERLVGFFLNTLVLRVDVAGDPTFAELLERVRSTTLEAYAHQELPFERVVQELNPPRDLSRSPLFQVLFVQVDQTVSGHEKRSAAAKSAKVRDLTVSAETYGRDMQEVMSVDVVQATQYDLEAYVEETREGLCVRFVYNVALFEAETMRRMLGLFRELVEHATQSPAQRLSELMAVRDEERHLLLDGWNDTAREHPAQCVPALVSSQAERTPEAVAVVASDGALTYAQLDARVSALSARLVELGIGVGDRVGVCVERTLDLPVSVLGVMASGAAYVPLDPGFPEERLHYMAGDAGLSAVVTQGRLARQWPGSRVLDLDKEGMDLWSSPRGRPAVEVGPNDLAYVIYTSGSTGRPKGVCIEHASLVNFLWSMQERPGLNQDDVLVSVTTLSFDIFGLELFLPLIVGARLVVASREDVMDGVLLARLLDTNGATVLQATPATWWMLLESGWQGRAQLKGLSGGEALPPSLAAQLSGRVGSLWNLYGPTETTIWSTAEEVGESSIGSTVSIGRPIGNTRVYVLDETLAPVPVGVSGELWIAGSGVARGYWERPELTAERFVADPFVNDPGARMYRTGDVARWRRDGRLEHLGRRDHQVKLRGYRIELGEVEAVLERHEGVARAVVACRAVAGESRLVAYLVGEAREARVLDEFARDHLPAYMVPSAWVFLDELPLTPNGKVDRRALPEPEGVGVGTVEYLAPRSQMEQTIARIWCEVLGIERVGIHDGFFQLGGHSLQLMAVSTRLESDLGRRVPIADLFRFPTVDALARFLGGDKEHEKPIVELARARAARRGDQGRVHDGIAVIGMAGRFPGAGDVQEYWSNLAGGVESIRFFTPEELRAAGVSEEAIANPRFVPARGMLGDIALFDADFFGYSPREAELLDPQQRIFLECAWESMERAGYDSTRVEGLVGVYAGAAINPYLWNLLSRPDVLQVAGGADALIGSDNDFLPMRVSYKLNFRGPSMNVQTTCSTSLVAVHEACKALAGFECDLAIAGGVTAVPGQVGGYLFQEGSINSPDGHCRPFDSRARGTVFGDGVGVVVLKRLSDALSDGDRIRAVIRGTSVNNDGADKVGFTAPSVSAQAQLVAQAHASAGVEARSIGYVEAHGTGTSLGDPIEVAALRLAFAEVTGRRCALGAAKGNVGHLDRAAGIAGLIKTVLMLEHAQIPPSLNFEVANPEIDFESSPFYVNTKLSDWERFDGLPRRAGVSSFGMGGTNAHVVLEEAPEVAESGPSRARQLLVLSAKSSVALEAASENLAAYLASHRDVPLADVAHTLRVGRTAFEHRRALVCRDVDEAATALRGGEAPAIVNGRAGEGRARPVVFLFPGQGAQYPNMGRELYEREAPYREVVEACCEGLRPRLGFDLRDVLFPASGGETEAAARLKRTSLTQPALFVTEYALARLLMGWGITPAAMAGHSIGEVVAACVSGVLSLDDALAMVVERGRLMETAPEGVMVSVALSQKAASMYVGEGVWLAAVNGPVACVLSCATLAAAGLEARLDADGVGFQRLQTSHAFHSGLMEPVLEPLRQVTRGMKAGGIGIPYVSNVSGAWMDDAELADGSYWARHVRAPVRFHDGVERLLGEFDGALLLEVGPGRALSQLVRARASQSGARVVTSLGTATKDDGAETTLTRALGELWVSGAAIDWSAYAAGERRLRVELPPYPFQRKRFWVEPGKFGAGALRPEADAVRRKSDIADWFNVPAWQRTIAPPAPAGETRAPEQERWLIFADEIGLGQALAERLRSEGGTVSVVRAGSAYSADGQAYSVAPTQAAHYDSLFDDLDARGCMPERIVHLWAVTGRDAPAHSTLVERCFHAPVLLAQCLGRLGLAEAVRMTVVSDEMHEVTGGESLCPEKALVLGPCRVISLEYPEIACRSVDLPQWPAADGADRQALEALVTELRCDDASEVVVAYRNGYRWIPRHAPARLEAGSGPPARLREGGVYLITGGLGGIGLSIAGYLAEAVHACLVLVSRGGLPPEAQWDEYLDGHEEKDATARRIGAVRELRAKGSTVLVEAVDVADRGQVEDLVARVRERFGAVHGVVHAAGVAGGGVIQLKTAKAANAVLDPKVSGTRILAEALRESPPDFLFLCSSINALVGVPGQVDYTAANAYLDAFAPWHSAVSPTFTISVNWDTWRDVGMAVDTEVPAAMAAEREASLGTGITPAEGVEVFRRALASSWPQVFVSPRVVQARSSAAVSEPPQEAVSGSTYQRPDLDVDFVAPRDETEKQVARMWSQLLGIDRIGVNDNFLDLGGHSLLATRLLARLRIDLNVDLTLEDIFADPTVASIAQRIRAAGVTSAGTGDVERRDDDRAAVDPDPSDDKGPSDLLGRVYAASKNQPVSKQ